MTILQFLRRALPLLLPFALATAQQNDTPPENTASEVQVKGVRDPAWKPYKAMLKGVEVFKDKHALAPAAELRFVLRPRGPADLHGVQLKLEGDEGWSRAIELDAERVFVLPVDADAQSRHAELYLNRKAGSFTWQPYIRSSGLQPNQRRMGDLRLSCAVQYAIDKDAIPFAMRAMIATVGGPCNFSKFSFAFSESKPLAAAVLVSGARRLALDVKAGSYSFIPPLHDSSWNDDSVVELTFANSTE